VIPIPLQLVPCEEVDDLLSEYLDGELDVRAVARVEVHLATCAGCARLAEELVATIAALHGLHGLRHAEHDRGAPPGAAAHR
jgi:anti-sigma factor RsiW